MPAAFINLNNIKILAECFVGFTLATEVVHHAKILIKREDGLLLATKLTIIFVDDTPKKHMHAYIYIAYII